MQMKEPERRAGWFTPAIAVSIVAVFISAMSMILGPAFGAFVAVIGTYVTFQSRSAVLETNQAATTVELKTLNGKVEQLIVAVQDAKNGSTETRGTLTEHSHRLESDEQDIKRLQEHDAQQEKALAGIAAKK